MPAQSYAHFKKYNIPELPHTMPGKYPPRISRDMPATLDFIPGVGKSVFASSEECKPLISDVYCGRDSKAINESRQRVMKSLNLFRNLLAERMSEQKGKAKTKTGATWSTYLETAMTLQRDNKWVNISKRLGPVPGVEVGDEFYCRAELNVIGLHRQFCNGIDYTKKDGKIVATSIVNSGRYDNDMKSSDSLIYVGQGGNPGVGRTQPKDQKLQRGNLALMNSKEAKTPVRVILTKKISKPLYIYHGLYLVEKFSQERGEFGKLVFKFVLKRISGQPKLTQGLGVVKKSRNSKVPKGISYVNDISRGKEKMPIRVVNAIDDERPPFFHYTTNKIYPKFNKLYIPSGCDCTDGCLDSNKCSCAMKNGGEISYNSNGQIVKKKSIVYECGPSCKCSSSCTNRVSQLGVRFKLEIFRTQFKGWGVRTRSYIPSGSFICEYMGEVPTTDATQYGNVGRFINHSCSPNLFAQKVLYDHDDKRFPHIMLFATKDIPASRELTIMKLQGEGGM
uniref:SET domain-containing protein n=1 Tax=Fagus sylvatica TaxID=28930 RepID=A0A2N9HJD0_FAGSY